VTLSMSAFSSPQDPHRQLAGVLAADVWGIEVDFIYDGQENRLVLRNGARSRCRSAAKDTGKKPIRAALADHAVLPGREKTERPRLLSAWVAAFAGTTNVSLPEFLTACFAGTAAPGLCSVGG
jgi:hypothetical protein